MPQKPGIYKSRELKAQRDLMKQGFDAVDMRFEEMQWSVDRRFSMLQWIWGGGVLLITTLMTIYQFLT